MLTFTIIVAINGTGQNVYVTASVIRFKYGLVVALATITPIFASQVR